MNTLPSVSLSALANREAADDPAVSHEVNQPIFFAAGIIIAGFVPLFTLSGVEGHIFGPMAKTYAYAIVRRTDCYFTISPALSSLLLPERVGETETLIVRGLRRVYEPLLNFAVGNRIVTLGGGAVLGGIRSSRRAGARAQFLASSRGRQFVDPRHLAATISLEEATPYVNRMRQIIRASRSRHGHLQARAARMTGPTPRVLHAEFNLPLNRLIPGPKVWTRRS